MDFVRRRVGTYAQDRSRIEGKVVKHTGIAWKEREVV
jgi:hypothetical protein